MSHAYCFAGCNAAHARQAREFAGLTLRPTTTFDSPLWLALGPGISSGLVCCSSERLGKVLGQGIGGKHISTGSSPGSWQQQTLQDAAGAHIIITSNPCKS